ncbi:MAG TPA: pseudouridine synthase [Burkholderiales bacterium]|nr:pseudouridine synthase [Burkholderiales bacterium]
MNDHRAPSPGGATFKLQKALAQAGLGSRRDMEELVRAGQVTVNGAPATIGARVSAKDVIQVNGRIIGRSADSTPPRVLLYYKPEGEIVSRDDPDGRPSVFDRLPHARGAKWLAVGRLDFNTSGLLILTTSGELANRMMHPRYELEREYAVRVQGRLSPEQQAKMLSGIRLGDGMARCEAVHDRGGEGANHWYHIVIREGRNREVRRLFESLRLRVSRLMRVRFGSVSLPRNLRRGKHVELTRPEVRQLLASLGLEASSAAVAPDARSARRRHPVSRAR